MSVIVIFSRFFFLRPLQTKETSEVTEHLLDIHMKHGPPEILQGVQGPEFKGVVHVRTVYETLNVHIIESYIQSLDAGNKTSAPTERGRRKKSLI